jgi:hypothetical protein
MQHRHLAIGLCLAGLGLAGAGLTACGASRAASAAGALAAAGSGTGTGAALGGSGNAGPPDASLSGIRACHLIPGPTALSVIGKLSEPAYQTPDGLACFYEPAVPGGVGPTIIVTVLKRSGYEASKSFVQGVEESNPGAANYVDIHGVGDDAFSTHGGQGAQDYNVYAALGGRAVNVSVASLTPVARQQAMALTKAALAAL